MYVKLIGNIYFILFEYCGLNESTHSSQHDSIVRML